MPRFFVRWLVILHVLLHSDVGLCEDQPGNIVKKATVESVENISETGTVESVGNRSETGTVESAGNSSKNGTVESVGNISETGNVESVGNISEAGTVESVHWNIYQDTFESQNYPGNYSENRHDRWEISFSGLVFIRFDFATFTLEDTGDYCKGDYVAIYRGVEENDNYLVLKLCGILEENAQMNVTDPLYEMLVIFHTDDSESAEGFQMTYTATSLTPDDICKVMSRVHGATEEISPFKVWTQETDPVRYPKVIDCVWTLQTNISYELSLEVNLLLDMIGQDCTHNFLEVRVPFNGSGNVTSWELTFRDNDTDQWFPRAVNAETGATEGVLLERVCGNKAKPLTYKTNAKMMMVIFHSDFAIENIYFRVTHRPIDSTRPTYTTWVQRIKHPEMAFEANISLGIPHEIPNLGLTIDTSTWILQTVPGFIFQFEIIPGEKNSSESFLVLAFDSPTTDPTRKINTSSGKDGIQEGYSSGFYLSLLHKTLYTGFCESCPQVKYKSLDVFTDSHPYKVEHVLFGLGSEHRLVDTPCCRYDRVIYFNLYSTQINTILSEYPRINADNCRYYGIVIYDGKLLHENQHGPFCEIFNGSIEFILNNFFNKVDTIYTVVYMYGDFSNEDFSWRVWAGGTSYPREKFIRLYSHTPGPRILDYKDNITITADLLRSHLQYDYLLFFMSEHEITGNLTTEFNGMIKHRYRSTTLLCANRSGVNNTISYLYTYNWETFIQNRDTQMNILSSERSLICNDPQLVRYYISVNDRLTYKSVYCNQNRSIAEGSKGRFGLTADHRHPNSCHWYIHGTVVRNWRVHIHKFFVWNGSRESRYGRLTIHEYPDVVTTFTNMLYPRVYTTLLSTYLHISVTSEYHHNIVIFVTQYPHLPGWTCINGICYQLIRNQSISWADADRDCSSRKAKLLYVRSIDELFTVKGIMQDDVVNDGKVTGLTFIGLRGTHVCQQVYDNPFTIINRASLETMLEKLDTVDTSEWAQRQRPNTKRTVVTSVTFFVAKLVNPLD